MSRNSRKNAKERRDKEKLARKAANRAGYASMRDSGANSKIKRGTVVQTATRITQKAKDAFRVGEIGVLLRAGPNRFSQVLVCAVTPTGYEVRLAKPRKPTRFNIGHKNIRKIFVDV